MAVSKNMFDPDYVVAPGDFAQEHLVLNGWSEHEFAEKCDLPLAVIRGVIEGTTSITHTIAYRFEKVLGVNANIWLRLEQMYVKGLNTGKVRIGHREIQYSENAPNKLGLVAAG